jgi:hypothetical protein
MNPSSSSLRSPPGRAPSARALARLGLLASVGLAWLGLLSLTAPALGPTVAVGLAAVATLATVAEGDL